MSEPDLMTTGGIAAWLRVTRYSIYRLLKQGIPDYRLGVEHLFKKAEVGAWMEAQAEAIRPKPVEYLPAFLLPDPKPVRSSARHADPSPPMSVAETQRRLKELMRSETEMNTRKSPTRVPRKPEEGSMTRYPPGHPPFVP
jgi:excisionase family DNA binding protein